MFGDGIPIEDTETTNGTRFVLFTYHVCSSRCGKRLEALIDAVAEETEQRESVTLGKGE